MDVNERAEEVVEWLGEGWGVRQYALIGITCFVAPDGNQYPVDPHELKQDTEVLSAIILKRSRLQR